MGSLVKCSSIIYDDFGNVLLAERGKKNERTWGLFGKDIKGKETDEKCISKAIDKDLKCTIFDLKSFKDYEIENGDILRVFTGTVKEYLTCHRSINQIKWVSKKNIDDYNINDIDNNILKNYFFNIMEYKN